MPAALEAEFEQTLVAYRKSRITMFFHALFIGACIAACIIARRIFGMPPQVMGVVLIVALVVFGKDIMTFMALRSKLARIRAADHSS